MDCENPGIHGKGLVENKTVHWKYRIRDYRFICEINEDEIVILVLEVWYKKNIYDNLIYNDGKH